MLLVCARPSDPLGLQSPATPAGTWREFLVFLPARLNMGLRTNIAVLVRKPFAALRTAVSKPKLPASIPVDPFLPDEFVATEWAPLGYEIEHRWCRCFAWLPVQTNDAGTVWCKYYWRHEMRSLDGENCDRFMQNFAVGPRPPIPRLREPAPPIVPRST